MTNLHHPDFCSCRACLTDAARRLVGQLGPGEARAAARHTVIPADIMDEAIAGQAAAPSRGIRFAAEQPGRPRATTHRRSPLCSRLDPEVARPNG